MVLSAIQSYPTKQFAGLFLGLDKDLASYFNDSTAVAGVTDLSFTQTNTHAYTFTAYGIPVSYTSDGSAIYSEIQAGLIAAIAAIPALVPLISAAASGNNLRITETSAANGSMGLTGLDGSTTATVVTAHSDLEPMPAGIVIAGTSTGFQSARLMRASGNRVVGITTHRHATIQEQQYPAPSTVNYPPNSQLNVARRGQIWCVTESAVTTLDDTVYARYAAGAGGTQLGAIRNSADSSTAVSLAGIARFRTIQATPGGLVLVQLGLAP